MEKLTRRQEDILKAIKKFMAKHGYPPTVREIGNMLNLSSPATTHFHLNRLEEKGYIKKNESKNRTIELLVPNEYEEDKGFIQIPLINKIKNNINDTISLSDTYFDIPTSIISNKKDIFAYKMNDNSMVNVGIYKDDILIIERKKNTNNGDKILAIYENKLTLKTYYKEKNQIRLQPESEEKPIISNKIEVIGKVVGLYRSI